MSQTYRVLSNIPELPRSLSSGETLHNTFVPLSGRPSHMGAWLHRHSFSHDAVILENPDYAQLRVLCLLRALTPLRRVPLSVVDLILPPPVTGVQRLKAELYKRLLRQVDLLLLYMKDTAGMQRHYGVAAEKARYIPFKVNDSDKLAALAGQSGDYIWTGGRSHRDYQTFCSAIAPLQYPTQIISPRLEEQLQHGSSFEGNHLPPHVSLVHDDGSNLSWNQSIAGAKLVVLPIRAGVITPAGVSAYLVAMALKKCVIITECPAVTGILQSDVM
jgi:hypothetical protein